MNTLRNTVRKDRCDRCGSCCQQGGPALHSQDKTLLTSSSLRPEHLITVRKGELAYHPLAQQPHPVPDEFLKIAGNSGDWCCQLYDNAGGKCTIYDRRPVACGLFNCTNPDDILKITGKDLLTRFDLIDRNDPMMAVVTKHEEQCPCPNFSLLPEQLALDSQKIIGQLNRVVRLDLDIRARAARSNDLSVELEMFYFGRPLFQLLHPFGIILQETVQGVFLHYTKE